MERTNEFAGNKIVHIVNTDGWKRGFTVALADLASGHKFSVFRILKEPTGWIPASLYNELKIVKMTCSTNG